MSGAEDNLRLQLLWTFCVRVERLSVGQDDAGYRVTTGSVDYHNPTKIKSPARFRYQFTEPNIFSFFIEQFIFSFLPAPGFLFGDALQHRLLLRSIDGSFISSHLPLIQPLHMAIHFIHIPMHIIHICLI